MHTLAPDAAAELDNIWFYIAIESGRTDPANKLIDLIAQRFAILARNPRLGRVRDDLGPGVRSFPVGDYVMVYRIQVTNVLILHALHSRRNMINLLPRTH